MRLAPSVLRLLVPVRRHPSRIHCSSIGLLLIVLLHSVVGPSTAPAQQSLLPDLIGWEKETGFPVLMHDWVINTTHQPGNWLLRFSVAIPNTGDGPFEVREESQGNGTQDIYQRIYDDQGGVVEHFIGNFVEKNTTFGHLSLHALAQYNLREVDGTSEIGDVVATNSKTSLCVVDSLAYPSPPGPDGTYISCGQPSDDGILGISVGYADLYSKNLENQWIDITGISDGTYWLEMVVDPNDRVLELDDTNNIERILVDLDVPDGIPLLDMTWRFDASGDWGDGNNWLGGGVPNSREQQAILGDVISIAKTVFTDEPVTINSLTIDNPQRYAVAGVGSLRFEDSSGGTDPTISVIEGAHEFQTTVQLAHDLTVDTASSTTLTFNNRLELDGHTLTKTGAGSMEINNRLGPGSGSIVVQQGIVSGFGIVHGNLDNPGGTVSPGSGNLQSVRAIAPEPATWSMFLVAWLLMLLHASRTR